METGGARGSPLNTVSPKLLIDMNLSPEWVQTLLAQGWEAAHWSTVGDPRATDREIMDWAAANQYVVFTHDLDFGTMLALSHEAGRACFRFERRTSCRTIWGLRS